MFFSPAATISLAGLKEVPGRLVIARWGQNESVNGNFLVNNTTQRILPALQRLLGFEEVTLDFSHNTVPGTEAYKAEKEPRNVAAHGAVRIVEDEGIVIEGLKWTPSGEKSVKEGLHPDLSPTIKTNDAGEVVFVHSAALCRQGAVTDLRVHSAADLFDAEKLSLFSAQLSALSSQLVTANTMDYKKLLTILLGLAPNASDADIETACKTYAENVKTAGDMTAHAATLKAVGDKVVGLEKKLAAAERRALVTEAIGVGKVVPHGAEIDTLSNEQFKALLEALPAEQVPLKQRTPEGLKVFSVVPANAAEAEVRKALGISEATWKKHNAAA